MRLTLEEEMEGVYRAEENCSVSSDWDGAWRVRIGGAPDAGFLEEAYVDSPRKAAEWLHERALIHFPDYAKALGITVTRPSQTMLTDKNGQSLR